MTNLVKDRYESRRRRMHRLPSIDEEQPTPISVILNRYADKIIRSPRYNNPVLVQRLENPELETKLRLDELKDREYATTDSIVNDYLHFSRYGRHVPMQGKFEETNQQGNCPCCEDRNLENAKLSKAQKSPRNQTTPRRIADDGGEHEARVETEEPTSESSLPTKLPIPRAGGYAIEQKTTPRDVATWLEYQPKPYVKHYLSPEYNRPSVVIDYLKIQASTSQKTHSDGKNLVKASTKYVDSMSKLDDTLAYLNGPLEYTPKPITIDGSFPKLSDYQLDKYRDLPLPYSDKGMFKPILGNPKRRYNLDSGMRSRRATPRYDMEYTGMSPRTTPRYNMDSIGISPRTTPRHVTFREGPDQLYGYSPEERGQF